MKSHTRALALLLALCMVTIGPIPTAGAVVSWPAGGVRVAVDATRIAGADRYGTAVAIARGGFPRWTDVSHVIIASGENRALPDAVAAGGLVWAYNAPLLLVRSTEVPSAVRTALTEMRSANGTITVTVVGGTVSVSAACVAQIAAIVGSANVERPWAGGDRYTTAASIALRMKHVATEESRTVPAMALVANGMDTFGFYDALSLSAISARTGAPVLFTMKADLPSATRSALTTLAPTEVIVAGSTAAVGAGVYTAVHGTSRLSGADRYGTAVAVAGAARTRGWLGASTVGIAASVIDAATGATVSGRAGSPVIYTTGANLGKAPALYLQSVASQVTSATVFGGTPAISAATFSQLEGAPAQPVLIAPASGSLVGKQAFVKVATGVNTTEVKLYIGATLVGTKAVSSYGTADFGKREMPASGVAFKVIAGNPAGGSTSMTSTYKRLSYPASTSIVIDKSDFKLYWVKDDVFVKAYPIAIGRASMETPVAIWKILAKYQTDPSSVYGPRKMRLFRRYVSGSGYKYVYTAYGIHGTNEPWVIGTKASHGCIRMYNRDVLELWPQVPIGTTVQTRE